MTLPNTPVALDDVWSPAQWNAFFAAIETDIAAAVAAEATIRSSANLLASLKATGAMAACTQRGAIDSFRTDTTNNSMNFRATCVAPKMTSLVDLVLGFPQYANQVPEANLPTGYTIATAAIEYPAGTFTQVFFAGSASQAVSPGAGIVFSDPCASPVIPAGATFWVKGHLTWTPGTFLLGSWMAASIVGDWTVLGSSIADHTLDATTQTTTWTDSGFAPAIYARHVTPCPVVGILGDSLSGSGIPVLASPTYPALNVDLSMQGQIATLNCARGGDAGFEMFVNGRTHAGRDAQMRNRITHLFYLMGRNEVAALATMQATIQKATAPYIARGVKVYACTVTPVSTSTDNWATTVNQTTDASESNRLAYNAWLRASFGSIGLTGIFDWAHVVDPSDTGKWNADGTAGASGYGVATLSGGTVASVALATFNGGIDSKGSGYPGSVGATIPCTVAAFPGDPGTGAAVHGLSDGSGRCASFVVDTPGSGYVIPPMVAANGQWTTDGTHIAPRAWHQIIKLSGMNPALLTL